MSWRRPPPARGCCERNVLRDGADRHVRARTARRADVAASLALRRPCAFDAGPCHGAARRLRAAAVSATSYATGQTVTFVHGPPDAPTWQRALRYAVRARLTLDHVMASPALPILFPAVRIGDGFYGDGSLRQTAPLAPAIHLGARAILAVTQRSDPERALSPARAPAAREYPALAEVIGLLLHAIFLDALEADAERLEHVNRLVTALPEAQRPDGLRPVGLSHLRARPRRASTRPWPR